LDNEGFRPAFMIAAGVSGEEAAQRGTVIWDDRDPQHADRHGSISAYIFRKAAPCNVDSSNLTIERTHNTFRLIVDREPVCLAVVSYYHERHAHIYVETFEPFRGRGYATKLFGWVSDWLTANGYIHESGCAIDNQASLALHRKLGFEVDGHIRWTGAPAHRPSPALPLPQGKQRGTS